MTKRAVGFSLIIFLGIFSVFCNSFIITVFCEETVDIIVKIEEVEVTKDCDGWPRGDPDPYGEARIAFPLTVWDPPQRTIVDDEVAKDNKATDLKGKKICFKEVPYAVGNVINLDWGIWDDDPWKFDDCMARTGETIKKDVWKRDPVRSRTVTGDYATVRVTIYIYEGCTGDEFFSNARGRRSFPSKVDPEQDFAVTLNVDVNEEKLPEYTIGTEVVPESFTYISASPPAEISYLTFDGYTYTILKWAFYGSDVQDRNIAYTLTAPNTAGTYMFAGELETESATVVEEGQTKISVGKTVGGIWVPVDKFGLLAPYIGVASTILVATAATAIYTKRVKRRKEKQ